ncbi:MAG TPA: hypothetical protein QF753_09650 [Victivallales bacterium]|nr:hypothetical protein [Victivallales bacterium]
MLRKLVVLTFLLLLVGCATTEERKDKAVVKARNYIFEKIPHMSIENATFIRYTYPEILEDEIANYGFSQAHPYSQLCLVWNLPKPKISLMVVGISPDNFKGWSPMRLIYKDTDMIKSERINSPRNYVAKEKPLVKKRAYSMHNRKID